MWYSNCTYGSYYSYRYYWQDFWPKPGRSTHGPIVPATTHTLTHETDAKPIKSVDMMKNENGTSHHTAEFHVTSSELDTKGPKERVCVVRRGQSFKVKLLLNRALRADEKVTITIKSNIKSVTPRAPNGSKVVLTEQKESFEKNSEWRFLVTSQTDAELILQISSKTTVAIAPWFLDVFIQKGKEIVDESRDENKFFLLFNPWNEEDDCYIADDDERHEYVMNEDGEIFVGSSSRNSGRNWCFGQFDWPVLETAMYLLRNLDFNKRRSPVHISRKMSAMVNSADDNGVLVGNWSGDYAGGTRPTEWTGSVPILEEYYSVDPNSPDQDQDEPKQVTPVKFGQCWVFSGLTTSLLRALGLPTRSVTNFDSAHDTDESCTKDELFDENGERLDYDDSIWNFHVWNEAFMRRPDLDSQGFQGYNGWQAIDATPQETSENVYQMGPCPLAAVKEGNVYIGHDTKFVFAEVNSDVVHWRYDKEMETFLFDKCLSDVVGTMILTKAVGSDDKHDVTSLYKMKEGSEAERLTVKNAVRHGARPWTYDDSYSKTEDVSIKVESEPLNLINDHFKYSIHLRNHGAETRNVSVKIYIKRIQYTGICSEVVQSFDYKLTLEPNQEKTVDELVKMTATVLMGTGDDSCLKIQLYAKVDETTQLITTSSVLPIELPPLTVETTSHEVRVGDTVEFHLQVPNPFSVPLTNPKFVLEIAGSVKKRVLEIGTVEANGTASTKTSVLMNKAGLKKVHAIYSCSQFGGSRGKLLVQVA